jgi:3'-5' exoribonuclease
MVRESAFTQHSALFTPHCGYHPMPRLPSVSALTASSEGWGFFLCIDRSLRTGRGGADYLALTLADATGEIAGRIFENLERLRDEFDAGEFVKVQGRVNLFNGRLQFAIENIRRVMTGPDSQDRRDGFREDALVPSAPRSADEMWAELQQVIGAVADAHLKTLLTRIVADHEAALRQWPAARTVHHAYRGGLLEHILTMTEAGRMLALLYGADVDLVVTGAILHDIGKLQELHYDTATTYTRDGNLVGHVTLGAIMVDHACKAIPGFPEALRAEVLHLIVSHHGERELGAPVEPVSIEAFILSAVDDLDATINQIRRALRDAEGGGEFTGYHPRLGRILWKGTRT